MKLEAGIEKLYKVIADREKFYQIPDYQRPYSWNEDNLANLIDDLTGAYINNNEEDYFCGSFVLVNDGERLDVIDGQQRITTFIIMACVIRDIYWNNLKQKSKDYITESIQDKYDENKRKLKFLTDIEYQNTFEQTVLKKINFIKTKNIKKDIKNNQYLQNAHYIKEFLVEKIDDSSINIDEFVVWLYEKVVITVITCPSQDSAIQIFNVLNNRGLPLTSIDILKASLMQKIQDNNEDRKIFKTEWSNIVSKLRDNDLDMESMLMSYLYYKIASNTKNRLDKELQNIFDKENKTPLEIIEEIKNFSESYIELLSMNDKHIFCLKYLRHKPYWTTILTTALFRNYKEIEKLKELLVAYYYQNWISGATSVRIQQTSFNIVKYIKESKDINEIKREIKSNLDKYKTTETFKEIIKGDSVFDNKWSKAILLLIEYFSDDNENPAYITINKKLHLEHILPQTPTDYWKKIINEEDIRRWTNSLANLTLLSMKKNIQAQNYSFEEKKEIYGNKDNLITSFKITQDLLNYSQWTTKELQEREEKLLKKIDEKLDIF